MGKLVSIEGISGSGKTTVSNILNEYLQKNGLKSIEVGGFEVRPHSSELTIFFRKLVNSKRFIELPWISESLLILAEIMHDIEKIVKPYLNEDYFVLFDGYFDSIFAFQRSRSLNEADKNILNSFINKLMHTYDIPLPDYTLFVTSELKTIKDRLTKRDSLEYDESHIALQENIQKEYLNIFMTKDIIDISNNSSVLDLEKEVFKILPLLC